MDRTSIKTILGKVARGEQSVEQALARLSRLAGESVGSRSNGNSIRFDHHRELRTGIPEVVYGEGKSFVSLSNLIRKMESGSGRLLVTRVDEEISDRLVGRFPSLVANPLARTLVLGPSVRPPRHGGIGIVSAGTTDGAVAEEASVTAAFLGRRVVGRSDVGVAGLHRLVKVLPDLESCNVLIAVAGMEGALPSVLAGFVRVPIVAVPTSVGYGAAFGGLAALLAMMNSCAPGVSVVNIDNGFGAAVVAAKIDRLAGRPARRARHDPP